MDIQNKKVTILGGMKSGQALAKLVIRLGGMAKVSDAGGEENFDKDFMSWAKTHQVTFEFGGHTKAFIEDSDIVVLSPGVSIHAEAALWAYQKGILVLGEIEFSFQFCKNPIIAVTGSNGKTTVVTLIHKVLQQAQVAACLCGNVGTPFAEVVLDLEKESYVVLEISSFQLESLLSKNDIYRKKKEDDDFYVRGFQPHIAMILNFSQNHLDRHKDLDEYYGAKKRIFLNQTEEDFAIVGSGDREQVEELVGCKAVWKEFYDTKPRMNPNFNAVEKVAELLHIKSEILEDVFISFKGVEHRMEKVKVVEGVQYINDSKSTTVEASRWAMTRIEQPVIMICGGKDKGMDFSVLNQIVKKKVKKMIVFGAAKDKLYDIFNPIVDTVAAESLSSAVTLAKESAQTGDCVLFSPMCASFDMFKNFEERGRVYKDIVRKLN